MIVALASLVPVAALPAAQEPARLHPGDAAVVLQIPDIQGLIGAYRHTALARMLADEDLHVSIGHLMGGPEGPPVDPLELALGEYHRGVDGGEIPPLLDMLGALRSFSMSLEVPDGDLFGFIMGMSETREEEAFVAANLGARFVADFVDEEAANQVADLVQQLLGDEAPGDLQLQPRAVTLADGGGFGSTNIQVWSFAPTQPGGEMDPISESIRFITGGNRLALTFGTVDGDEYVDALVGGALDGSAGEMFAAGRGSFGKAPATPMLELYVEPFIERLVTQMEPNALPLLDLAEGLVGPLASMVIRGGHWRIGLQDGQYVTEGYCQPSGEGPLVGLIGAQPLDASSLTLSHPDALVTSVTSLDPDVLARFVEALAAQQGDGVLDEIERDYGFRPEQLAASLGNAVSYSLPTLKSLLSAPNLMGAAQLRDRQGFIEGMDGLLAMAEDMANGVTVTRKDYKGSMLYTLVFSPEMFDLPEGLPIDPSTFFRPTITVMEDRVMFTTLPSHAQKEIRRIAKLAKNGESPGVHAQITALGDLGGATTVGYADWPTFFGNLYAQLRSLAPLVGSMMGGGELPIDVNALPEPEQLTRHFKPSQRWSKRIEGHVVHYSKSSIGPETSILPVAGAAVFGMRSAQAARAEAEWIEVEAVRADAEREAVAEEIRAGGDPAADATRDTLENVSVAITLYQLDHKGVSPAKLADLTAETSEYPNGYLDSDDVPTDGWGRELVYAATDDGFSLRSVGANGIDESGAGDDVVLE